MTEQNVSLKVAKDLYLVQLVWTFAFLGIIFIVNVVKIIYAYFKLEHTEGFFNTSFIASNFYMFIIGLIAIHFLTYFVGNGVTRKDYFIGNTFASIGLAMTIAITTSLIFIVEKFILKLIDLPYKVQTINELDLDGNILGDAIQMIIVSPYVNPNENILLATSVLFINTLILYILGWMISATFYHYGTVNGIVAILISVTVKFLKDNLLRISLDLPTIGWFKNIPDMPEILAIFIILLIIILIYYVIRMLTKRIPVKM